MISAREAQAAAIAPLLDKIRARPLVERSHSGSVHLSVDGGLSWIPFVSDAEFGVWLEEIDRQLAP